MLFVTSQAYETVNSAFFVATAFAPNSSWPVLTCASVLLGWTRQKNIDGSLLLEKHLKTYLGRNIWVWKKNDIYFKEWTFLRFNYCLLVKSLALAQV